MKPAPFTYQRAESVDHAIQLLQANADGAKVLAGGQSLVPLMNLRLAQPEMLVDIARVPELSYIKRENGTLQVGAVTVQRALETDEALQTGWKMLGLALKHLGHEPIRNRGTVGGSIAHADPAAELPVVLTALNGSVVLRSARGTRVVPAEDFFQGFLMTSAEPDEIVTEVRFPEAPEGTTVGFQEFARRPGDFGLVAAAAVLHRDGQDRVRSLRVVLGGVSDAPVVVPGLDAMDGVSTAEATRTAVEQAQGAISPSDDIHATARFRRHLAGSLIEAAVQQAAQA